MAKHGHLRLTPEHLKTDEYRHGPCYVLCPKAWAHGERVVLAVLDPLPEKVKPRPRKPPEQPVRVAETRRIVTWPKGRPADWRLVETPVAPPEPRWAARARELRALGWSLRRIAKELGMSVNRRLRELLDS